MPIDLRGERDRAVVAQLQALRKRVRAGLGVWAALCECQDASAQWHTRMALMSATAPHGHVATSTLADWDEAQGRTQAERVSLVDRALYLKGVWKRHGGGWRVTSGARHA